MRNQILSIFVLLWLTVSGVWADDFTVERAINLSQLDSWADISQFQWQEIDHGIQDNGEEMSALINLFYDPAPKDTVGFYNKIYQARDNQYIVLRLDKGQGNRPFYLRVTGINSTEDPLLNTSKTFSVQNYAYIMPPIGETQLEVKIWPQGEGVEKAKTFTFNSHSYGSASLRSVMLDKSRIVPGNYDLQLIYYDEEVQKSDTSYIESLVTDKLYTFYDYNKGDLVEAYLRVDGFKRIRLKPEWWAMDAVTHVNDNSVMVMTGSKMPFRQHKRMDAPNPTYLDSRLFSHHDTLWVNLYLDKIPSFDAEGLTLHAVRADFDNMPTGKELLTWGKDPVSQRLYVLTDGEPCTIECYRDGYLPKLCLYPGSYDHITGIISGESEEVDIYLEGIPAPITSPTVTSAILSTLKTTSKCRGDYYVSEIVDADITKELLTDRVFYDEYASHMDTVKVANGQELMSYALMKTAIVSPRNAQTTSDITLKKVENAEENAILKETLSGDTESIYSNLFDYSYWTTTFDLREYLDINTEGRPAVAFNGTIVRQLPILSNVYVDIQGLRAELDNVTRDRVDGKEAGDTAKDWITEIEPSGSSNISFKVPINPPFYFRFGIDVDFFKTRKMLVSWAFGAGFEYDIIEKKSNMKPASQTQSFKLTSSTTDDTGFGATDVTPVAAGLNKEPSNYTEKDAEKLLDPSCKFNAFVEFYLQNSLPMPWYKQSWKQWLTGMQWIDEVSLRAEANIAASLNLDFFNALGAIGGMSDDLSFLKKTQSFMNGSKWGRILKDFMPVQMSAAAGARLNVTTGIFSFNNPVDDGWGDPLKTHIVAFKFLGQAFVNLQTKFKVDVIAASAEAGVNLGAGINFKYAGGSRLDFRNSFSGSAYSWYAGAGAYYKVKAFGWKIYDDISLGRLTVQQRLIEPKSYKNPFHKNFTYYLSDEDDPSESNTKKILRKATLSLPGDFVTDLADYTEPVKFISGGDSVIYQGFYEDPNDYAVEVASTGDPITLSDWRLGGCTSYDAASIPGMDMVLLEQATAPISQEDLTDTLHLDETVKRASCVYGIYYTKKETGTKWYSPKPVYSSAETTSYKPRVALADDGTGVAIWQEGLMDKGSWITPDDTVQLTDLVMNGKLMMSRFDGQETWSAPIELMSLDESCMVRDYRITYDGSTTFIIARKMAHGTPCENICMTVDATDNITTHEVEKADDLMQVCRVGDNNILAWMALADSVNNVQCVRVRSYGMDGNPKEGINTSILLNQTDVEDFRIVPDLQAKSLSNVALLWRETTYANDSASTRLMASRLVPHGDGTFGIGTPITTVQLEDGNTMYGYDGYMTNEKMQVCYVAVDEQGNSQLNKTAAYFGNAFGYTVEFDTNNNQGFQCDKNEITLLITVNNYGTSTINECVLSVDGIDQQFPLDMTIPAGAFAKERVVIPYKIGAGVNTTMRVKYDDVLGTQEQTYANYAKRRAARINGIRKAEATNNDDAVYEQHTKKFYPYQPRLECFVAAQRVDKNGDNHITICVRNYSRRRLDGEFALIVGLKENSYSSIMYNSSDKSHNQYEKKFIYSNTGEIREGLNYMHDYGSYRAGYVTLTVPGVTEKKQLYVGATMVYSEPMAGLFLRLVPATFSGSNNSGVVTLYPSSEVVAVDKVYNNDDAEARMHVSQQAGTLVVTGAEPRQQVRLYQGNGAIIARRQADEEGKVTFVTPLGHGVGLVSSDEETVKFIY